MLREQNCDPRMCELVLTDFLMCVRSRRTQLMFTDSETTFPKDIIFKKKIHTRKNK